MWPHRWQPTRLSHPWDSPGNNTGVGFHFLLQCVKVKSESEVAQLCPTFSDPMACSPPGSSIRGISLARILEWAATSYSRWSFWPRDLTLVCCVSCIGRQIWKRHERTFNSTSSFWLQNWGPILSEIVALSRLSNASVSYFFLSSHHLPTTSSWYAFHVYLYFLGV